MGLEEVYAKKGVPIRASRRANCGGLFFPKAAETNTRRTDSWPRPQSEQEASIYLSWRSEWCALHYVGIRGPPSNARENPGWRSAKVKTLREITELA